MGPGNLHALENSETPVAVDQVNQPLLTGAEKQMRMSGAADRHRHTVHHQRLALADPHEVVQRFAAGDQAVLGERLEPVERRVVGENRFIALDPQAATEAKRGTR